ncbi:hypothetical protein K3495_g543 [Podosphaera aphanis]|nr:hypothetical protein K3495_g543 [Podosphaera aphanis]
MRRNLIFADVLVPSRLTIQTYSEPFACQKEFGRLSQQLREDNQTRQNQ